MLTVTQANALATLLHHLTGTANSTGATPTAEKTADALVLLAAAANKTLMCGPYEAEARAAIAAVDGLRAELEAARIIATLYAWTGGGQETDRELALFQAWDDYAAAYGTPKPTPEWDQRITELAARRRARRAEVHARLSEIVRTGEVTDRG